MKLKIKQYLDVHDILRHMESVGIPSNSFLDDMLSFFECGQDSVVYITSEMLEFRNEYTFKEETFQCLEGLQNWLLENHPELVSKDDEGIYWEVEVKLWW